MSLLSLSRTSKVRVLSDNGGTELVPLEKVPKDFKVVDWYGNIHDARIEGQVNSRRHMFRAVSGETVVFGDEHTVLCRYHGEPRFKRIPVASIEKPVWVRLPQRKITIDDCVVAALDGDKTGMFLRPDKTHELLRLMESAGTSGVIAQRDKKELKIVIEAHRPSCFFAKLVNGNFQSDLEETLGSLVAKAIIQPHGPFNDAYLEQTKRLGVICEGSSLYNDIILHPAGIKELKAPCYLIEVDHEDIPIEMAWFCT